MKTIDDETCGVVFCFSLLESKRDNWRASEILGSRSRRDGSPGMFKPSQTDCPVLVQFHVGEYHLRATDYARIQCTSVHHLFLSKIEKNEKL